MGPTCEVLLTTDDGAMLDAIDDLLASRAERIDRTRRGRVWDVWIGGRPVHVSVGGKPPSISLSAGCNDPEDYAVLRQLGGELAAALGGSDPVL